MSDLPLNIGISHIHGSQHLLEHSQRHRACQNQRHRTPLMYSVNTEDCSVIFTLVSGSLTCRLNFIKPMNSMKRKILCLCACVIFGEENVHSPYQISKSPSLLCFILLFKGKQVYCLLSTSPTHALSCAPRAYLSKANLSPLGYTSLNFPAFSYDKACMHTLPYSCPHCLTC